MDTKTIVNASMDMNSMYFKVCILGMRLLTAMFVTLQIFSFKNYFSDVPNVITIFVLTVPQIDMFRQLFVKIY